MARGPTRATKSDSINIGLASMDDEMASESPDSRRKHMGVLEAYVVLSQTGRESRSPQYE